MSFRYFEGGRIFQNNIVWFTLTSRKKADITKQS